MPGRAKDEKLSERCEFFSSVVGESVVFPQAALGSPDLFVLFYQEKRTENQIFLYR